MHGHARQRVSRFRPEPCSAPPPIREASPIHRTFAALRHRDYRIWAAADLVSITGTWMQVLALNWYVLHVTGSATQMGLTVLLQTAPVILLGPWGGALADRLPGRPTLVVTQLAHAGLALSLAGIAFSGQASVLAVYLVAAGGGVISALEGPVMGRFNATLIDRDTLSNALSLGSMINSAGRIIGMSVGGVLVAAVGLGWLFLLNAGSFLAVIAGLLAIRSRFALDEGEAEAVDGGVRAGLAYLVRQPAVLVALGLGMVLGSLGRNYQVTMAAMTDGPLGGGAAAYGVLSATFAIGAMLGGLAAARRRRLDYRTLVGAGLIGSALQIAAGASPNLWSFAGLILPIAAMAVLIDTTVSTRIQLDTHGAMRGRVLAAASMASAGAGAIGAPVLGWLAEHLGARSALVLAGALATAGCLAAGAAFARQHGIAVTVHQVRVTLRDAVGLPAPAR